MVALKRLKTLAIVGAIAGTALVSSLERADVLAAQLPLVTANNLVFEGAFQLPAGTFGGADFAYDGHVLAYNPGRNSLFIGSLSKMVAEISIPAPVKSSNVAVLPTPTVLAPFTDPTENRLGTISEGQLMKLGGLLVFGQRLIGTAYIYYDANGVQRKSHYARPLDLTQKGSVAGMQSVGDPAQTGTVSGYMTPVPSEWQGALGGPALTGQCCIPIVSRTSWGPGVASFDPARLGGTAAVPAKRLLYYPASNPLVPWEQPSSLFNGTSSVGGIALPAGTRSLLFFGKHGYGDFCYGEGSAQNPPPADSRDAAGAVIHFCYDPVSSYKGQHAYPYRLKAWAYDVSDLAAVAAGKMQSWEPKPYAHWDLPTPFPGLQIGGVAYDPATQRIFMSQEYSNGMLPVILVFKVTSFTNVVLPAPPRNVRIVS